MANIARPEKMNVYYIMSEQNGKPVYHDGPYYSRAEAESVMSFEDRPVKLAKQVIEIEIL